MWLSPGWHFQGYLICGGDRVGTIPDWAAGATTTEVTVATLLSPTFSGPLDELLTLAEATATAPSALLEA